MKYKRGYSDAIVWITLAVLLLLALAISTGVLSQGFHVPKISGP